MANKLAGLILPGGETLQEQQTLSHPSFNPQDPSHRVTMGRPNPAIVNTEPFAMLREALGKMLVFQDLQTVLLYNIYTELMVARGQRQAEMLMQHNAVLAPVPQPDGPPLPYGVVNPETPPPSSPNPAAEAATVAGLQVRPVAPLQPKPNRQARRHSRG